MSAFDGIRAQDGAIEILTRAAQKGRLASAYLFEGPSGVGKQRTALALASHVIAGADPELRRRIEAAAHPDVRIFTPRDEGDRNLQIATVRDQILPFTQYAPFEGKAAFLVFPDADVSFPEGHPEAANALLKTLEEPRPGVHFILLAGRPDRLLTTIRSRCQKVRFGRLPAPVLDEILRERGIADEARIAAVALADGRADRAIALAADGAADALLELAMRIDDVASAGRPGGVVALADELGKRDEPNEILDALSTFYRDVAAAALGVDDSGLAFRHRAARIRERAEHVGAVRAARACEKIRAMEEALEGNANKEIAFGDLLFAIG